MVDIIASALVAGYRFLDLAQEYGNEDAIEEVFNRIHEDPESNIYRNDIFIQSKVWPTHLGYQTTFNTILQSMTALSISFIDSYLLHWPRCDASVEWMHCDDTVDPDGTWQASYNALQRAYSEGLVNSIGVSNFNIELLKEIETSENTVIFPHIVQNFADFTYLDMDVRTWCDQTTTIYQPYAQGRNVNTLPDDVKAKVGAIASHYSNKTPYALALRFFLQTGAAVIPRSNNKDHLVENLNVLSWDLTDKHMEELGWPSKTKAEL
jgi:diketogulonate reductase-like aldo/keto reductase